MYTWGDLLNLGNQVSDEQLAMRQREQEFDDPVSIELSDLPDKVTAEDATKTIAKDSTSATFTLKAAKDAPVTDGKEVKVTANASPNPALAYSVEVMLAFTMLTPFDANVVLAGTSVPRVRVMFEVVTASHVAKLASAAWDRVRLPVMLLSWFGTRTQVMFGLGHFTCRTALPRSFFCVM